MYDYSEGASAAKMEGTVYKNFWHGSSPVKALWECDKEKATVEENSLNSYYSSPKGIWETPRSTGRRFFGLMRPKWSFLAIR